MLDATTAAMAQSIQNLHAATFAGLEPLQPPAPTGNDPVYLAALHACSQLGFITHDAECLARAWHAQSTRTGQFDAALWPSDPSDFGLQPTPRVSAFVTCPQALGLYAVLPDADWVGRMARAGVPTVQLRYKSDDAVAIAQEVRKAVAAVAGTPALLFINDHWREALPPGPTVCTWGRKTWMRSPLKNCRPCAVQACGWASAPMGMPRWCAPMR